ncbi:PadR family transcriptional regulator [Streptomyces atratus]|uniref:PadR family transcriptional regulator n=1 Tax=Streptomyces atratus TaxID=1893 RepID=UPI0021A8C50C|nr:PadR family transcriptional regulator [Streptomyces atratus]MCT2546693.1 PadR family transcriptional regulator [Streptomyces atratus]
MREVAQGPRPVEAEVCVVENGPDDRDRGGPAVFGDGSLYPAISRLVKAGLLDRRAEPGASAAQRHTLSPTTTGRTELLRRLRDADGLEISDGTRHFTVLAFLSRLPDTADRHAVLRRRLEFLEQPASFFHDGDVPLGAEDTGDPYRRGMLTIARATSRAERAWLRVVLS